MSQYSTPTFHEMNAPILVPIVGLEWADFVVFAAWNMGLFLISMLLVAALSTWLPAILLGGLCLAGDMLLLSQTKKLYNAYGGVPRDGVLFDAILYILDSRKLFGRNVESPYWYERVFANLYVRVPVLDKVDSGESINIIASFVVEGEECGGA